jgi:hypothetical protein
MYRTCTLTQCWDSGFGRIRKVAKILRITSMATEDLVRALYRYPHENGFSLAFRLSDPDPTVIYGSFNIKIWTDLNRKDELSRYRNITVRSTGTVP